MSNQTMRHCYVCNQYKSASDFNADASRVCKVASKCRDCARTAMKARKKRQRITRVLADLGLIWCHVCNHGKRPEAFTRDPPFASAVCDQCMGACMSDPVSDVSDVSDTGSMSECPQQTHR